MSQLQIIVCETDNILPSILPSIISLENIREVYDHIDTKGNYQNLWEQFNNIILYEYFTFLSIMNITNPDLGIVNVYEKWKDNFARFDINSPYDNYVLVTIFSELGYNIKDLNLSQIYDILKPSINYFKETCNEYIDVYSQDLNNIQEMSYALKVNSTEFIDDLRTPIILLSDNKYISHIYQTNFNSDDLEARFIGIRESLLNTFHKIYELPAIRGIGYILLDSIKGKMESVTTLRLISPIGPMRHIAEKSGFIDDDDDDDNHDMIYNKSHS